MNKIIFTMLTYNQRYKIITGVKEYPVIKDDLDKSTNLKNELIEFIFNVVVKNLTEDELKFVMLYQEYLNSKLSLDFNGKFLNNQFPEEHINCLNYGDELYYSSINVEIKKTIDGKIIYVPALFDSWGEFKDKYPKDYSKAVDILKKYLEVSCRVSYKLKKLNETLDRKDINLTELKNNFIELYNILKA